MVHTSTQPPRRRSATTRKFGRITALLATAALIAFPAQAASAVVAPDTGCGVRPLDVVITIDRSTSMGSESRLTNAKKAAKDLVASLDANGGVGGSGRHHVGLTSYAGTSALVDVALGTASAATVTSAINGLAASGNTPTKHGMASAAADMTSGARSTAGGLDVTHVIIFLSDGEPNPTSEKPTAGEISSFKGAADQVFTIALGVSGSGIGGVDPAFMASLAKPNDASHAYWAKTSGELPNIFDLIYKEIACTPGIAIDKTADATDLPVGGASVTYGYAVTNTGNVALSNVSVSDDKCSPVGYVGGDTDSDSRLDLTETWTFSCTMDVTDTLTNIATATGSYGNASVDAKAQFTVNVALPTEPPVTEPPVTEPPVTEPPVTEPPVTEPPVTEPPVTEPPVTEPPVTEPPVTEPPVTEPPVTEPPVTEPPVTEPPVTEPPVTEPPVTEPPVTEPPVTEPPVTEPPVTAAPTPSGTVLAETSKPTVTPPPTDAGSSGSTGSGSIPLILGLLAVIALAATVRPASLRNRSR